MAELMDRRPKLVIVMGCNGAGKSAWKRNNYDRLPERYFDQDSIAGGIGDWNEEGARARTREYVDGEIEKIFAARMDFGFESTFSGRPGPALVRRAINEGYCVEGYFVGTDSWEINARRIEQRVATNTGHHVDPVRLPDRYRYSLSNLRRHLDDFDLLEAVDNSEPAPEGIPEPRVQFVVEKGQAMPRPTLLVAAPAAAADIGGDMRIVERAEDYGQKMRPWASDVLRRREIARQQAELREKRKARGRDRGGER